MNRTAAICRAAATVCALLLVAAPLATRLGLVSWKLGLPLTALAILGGAVLLPATAWRLLSDLHRPRLVGAGSALPTVPAGGQAWWPLRP